MQTYPLTPKPAQPSLGVEGACSLYITWDILPVSFMTGDVFNKRLINWTQ